MLNKHSTNMEKHFRLKREHFLCPCFNLICQIMSVPKTQVLSEGLFSFAQQIA